MRWKIEYSRDSMKFVKKHDILDEVRDEIKKFLKKIKGEDVNINLKKLEGSWIGYYRLRKGKIRIIFEVYKIEKSIFVEKIDFRGDVYK